MTVTLETQTPTIEQIIRRHQADVWRFLLALGCKPHEAEDLTQEVFVEVFRRGFEYRGEPQATAYLRKAAKHRFISTVRKRKRAPLVTNLDDIDVEWGAFQDRQSGDARIAALRLCLETLTERASTALALKYRDEMLRDEIAAELDMKAAGVKSLLERARAKLRECVERKRSGHE